MIKNFNENYDSKGIIFIIKCSKKIISKMLIEIMDVNFQNFNDYPIIVNRKWIKNFLFSKGVRQKRYNMLTARKFFKRMGK